MTALPGAGALRELLGDIAEVAAAFGVMGLAWPDPDLTRETTDLAERAREAGMEEGARRLEAVAAALEALAASREREQRQDHARAAFDALQRLVAWERAFRVELDLLEVQANLVRGETVVAEPGETRRVWPVGFDLRGQRLTIVCLDDGDGRPVVLVDTLLEVDRMDPLGRPVISRLFQDRIQLREVLSGVVELVDHPVSGVGGRRVFAPAFHTRPRVRRARGGPRLTELVEGSEGLDPRVPGPGRVRARVVCQGERVGVRAPSGLPVLVAATSALRTTLSKWVVREGNGAELELVLRFREGHWEVLAVEDPLEGRSYPAWDPRAFPLSGRRLTRVAPEDALWLRTALAWLGGFEAAEVDALAAQVREAPAADPLNALRLGWAARMLDVGRPVDEALVAQALGSEDPREVLAGLWLAEAGERDAEAPEGSPGDDLASSAVQIWRRTGSDLEAAQAAAAAHLDALRRQAGDPETPLPEPLDLLLFAEALARMQGGERGGRFAEVLGLPRDRVWRAAVEALLGWRITGAASPTRAGDALFLALAAGLGSWIGPG